jgi:hypothetical protein
MSYIKEFEAELAKKLQSTEPPVSGGMKVVESWRFEIPFSSRAFSSGN